MKDMQAHLETLQSNIAQCERLRAEARSKIKLDIFGRLAAHYRVLARELEKAIEAERDN